ncbi:MAG: pyruvoyl-dependent arginine decarboxylase [Haloferacaceae archaeon]
MDAFADPIQVVTGRAEGHTELDAFDAALADAGVHNYNLVTLSSVVPVDTAVSVVDEPAVEWPTGAPVAVVLAERTTATATRVAAGLGWALADEGGVFYEATSSDADACRRELRRGLRGARDRRDWDWEDGSETEVVEFVPDDPPGAVVAAAVYGPPYPTGR